MSFASIAAIQTSAAGCRPPQDKLAKAAGEFEAILLASWMEKMKQSFAAAGDSEPEDPARDTLEGLGNQAVASALAARGGIGVARMLLHQLQPESSSCTPAPKAFSAFADNSGNSSREPKERE